MTIHELQQIVDEYLRVFPDEAGKLDRLQKRLDIDEIFNNRKSFAGHGTCGALVLSPDKKKLLLINHNFLQRWLQPGGHWDPEDPNPWTVARREAEEETGITGLNLMPLIADKPHVPIDIDSHDIPANDKKREPAHVHHDFRYVFVADSEDLKIHDSEVSDARWIPLVEIDQFAPEFTLLVAKIQNSNILEH